MSKTDKFDIIHRKEAASKQVSYGNVSILYDTKKTRKVFIPFYIKHSDYTELAAKLITYRKNPPPLDWKLDQEQSISLDESSARNLLQALKKHFAVSEQSEDGDYVVIRIEDGQAIYGELDPTIVAKAIINILGKKDIVRHLASQELGNELVSAFRGAIRLKELQSAVAQLRQYLDSGEIDEQVYQKWCEQHSWAFGNAYVIRDEVREISPGDKIDLLLPTVIAGYRDLVELKRPNMEVLIYDNAHRNYYFASDVSKAIGQCHRYLDVLHEEAKNGLRDHPEIVAYHPRATIVIGRSHGWEEEKLKALHGLNCRLNGITVITYDQLLAQGERLVEALSADLDEKEVEDENENEDTWDFDVVPF